MANSATVNFMMMLVEYSVWVSNDERVFPGSVDVMKKKHVGAGPCA